MMYAIKTPSFFKPSSRPSSPSLVPLAVTDKIDVTTPVERSRPLPRLSLANFRRQSPSSTTTPPSPVTLIQDGSYLEVLNLKLSEAVSKALAQTAGPATAYEQLDGRRPIPSGRGHALGAFIAAELAATSDKPHLKRAIIRCLQRPLSVLLSNISAHLLPLLSSPVFLTITLNPQTPNLNPTQIHAVALATLAGEVLESFDELGLGLENDARSDGLRVTREGLVSVVSRVVNPLFTGIQNEMLPVIDRLENSNPLSRTGSGLSMRNSKAAPPYHPSILSLQSVTPIYAKALAKIATSRTAQSSLATTLIGLVWHAVLALSHRSSPAFTPTSSPLPPSAGVKGKTRMPFPTPPPTSPPPAKFTMKSPPSRPSTPPHAPASFTPAGDARALYELLNLLPRPSKENEVTTLAWEAVDEAFEGLAALVSLLDMVQNRGRLSSGMNVEELEAELELITEGLPTLIGLPVILRTYAYNGSQDGESRSVASMLGMKEAEYRKNCLTGFNRADDCEEAVGQHVIRVLRTDGSTLGELMVAKWLERQIRDKN